MGNDFYGPNSGAAAQSAATIQREEEEEGGSEIEFPSTSTSRKKKKKKKEEKFFPLDLMEPFKKEEKENPPLPPLRKIFSIQMLPGEKIQSCFYMGIKIR